jgi:hypothetical protein
MVSKIRTIKVIDFNSVENHVKWIDQNRVKNHNNRLFPAKVINLDFSLSKFLKPYHIAPLACLIHEYQAVGFKIIISKTTGEIQTYLESFAFDQFCRSGKHNTNQVSKDKKTFPLWHIEESGKEFYTIMLQDYFERNLFSGKDLFVLGNSLGELMNNIFDHAQSKVPGYTFTQYNTRTNSIITCVCDFGTGIPNSVNHFLANKGEPRLDNDQALMKAFELKFSALTRPHNRGFGWDTVLNNIKSFKGKLHIVSNNTLFVLHPNGKINTQLFKSNFHGTLVVITLNTINLPLKEENHNELELF